MSYLFSLLLSSFIVFGLVNAYALFLHKDKVGFSFFRTTLLIMDLNIEEYESINKPRLGFILWAFSLPRIFAIARDQIMGTHPSFFSHDFIWAEVISSQLDILSEQKKKEKGED